MKAEFHTSEYEFSHGASPRGRGSWAFEVDCVSEEQKAIMLDRAFHGVVSVNATDKPETVRIWTRGSTTYQEAKAQVKNFLRSHFTTVYITVCS